MTIEECREHLPESWIAPIQNDAMLREIFADHEYELEMEAVPPFLIQELRCGNVERLRPILALYGEPGLELLRGLMEIDEASRDTATITGPDGQVACAGYFFARYRGDSGVEELVRRHVQAVREVYLQVFQEEPPVDESVAIQILTGREGYDFRMQQRRELCEHKFHPGDEIYEAMGDWIANMFCRGSCGELDLLGEALYHISNDYMLSHFLRWPLLEHGPMENPFRAYFELWKMGLHICFPARDRAVLVS